MERLLEPHPRVIVIDSKHRVRWPGYHLTDDPVAALLTDKVIYRPKQGDDGIAQKVPAAFWVQAMDSLHERGGGIIYVDELAEETTPNRIPPGLSTVQRLGREIGVSVWWASQESTGIHNTMLRQTDVLCLFLNIGASDRDKVIATTGDIGEVTAHLGFYEFVIFQSYGAPYDPSEIPVYKVNV
jgi:hypothetical protein